MSDSAKGTLLEARDQQSRTSLVVAAKLQQAVLEFLDKIDAALRSTQNLQVFQAVSHQATSDLTKAMDEAISSGLDHVSERVVAIWKSASQKYASDHGVTLSNAVFAALGVLGVGAALQWKTVLTKYAQNGAIEILSVVRAALAAKMTPDDLARRLRKYVIGSDRLEHLFVGDNIDLRAVPQNLRGAAQQMLLNSTRIAFTEVHNARALAEVRLFIADPLVDSVQWLLSPYRGNWNPPDECDLLALTDFYGLGPGVYPVTKVPSTPHPFDRCERMPRRRDPSLMDEPKSDPPLLLDPLDSNTVQFPRGGRITATAANRARQSAWEAMSSPMS